MAFENRNDKLLKFYSECMSNGYTNMKDSTQSLKAKVIATDLGLDYKKIGILYEEAKKATEEQHRLDAKEGTLLLSFYSSSNYTSNAPWLELYKCEDNSYYSVVNGKRVSGTPDITVETQFLPEFYHRAPSTTFYGVSYNGISSGTVSHDPGGTTSKMKETGNGFLVIRIDEEHTILHAVIPSASLANAFKRDNVFLQYYNGQALIANNTVNAAYSYNGDIYDSLRQSCLPLTACYSITDLLRRMVNELLPPSDQELYEKAIKLASSKSASDVKQGADIFALISDYKDSKERYDEAIQLEKEKTIIEKEKTKRGSIIVIFIIAAVSIALFLKWAIPAYNSSQISSQTIKDNLIGQSFEYFDYENHGYSSSSSYGYETRTTIKYSFSESTVRESTTVKTNYNTKAAASRYVNGEAHDYRSASEKTTTSTKSYDYKVKGSLLGGVKLIINNRAVKLTLDENNMPITITDGKKTFK